MYCILVVHIVIIMSILIDTHLVAGERSICEGLIKVHNVDNISGTDRDETKEY